MTAAQRGCSGKLAAMHTRAAGARAWKLRTLHVWLCPQGTHKLVQTELRSTLSCTASTGSFASSQQLIPAHKRLWYGSRQCKEMRITAGHGHIQGEPCEPAMW
jgi:hypothetical protein